MRLLFVSMACWALLAAGAHAAPPPNDNYLASTQMKRADGSVEREFRELVDTREATTQGDLFDFNSDGFALGGGPAETTRCGPSVFGATVWYDFIPEVYGGVEIRAGGYDTVVTVYEYNVANAAIVRTVTCSDRPDAGESVQLPAVQRGVAYTIQVGGAGAVGGTLDFSFEFFGDADHDGVLDEEPDRCLSVPGVGEAGGCPPRLVSQPRVRSVPSGRGVELLGLAVAQLAPGSRVVARCARCGLRQSRTVDGMAASMGRFTGAKLPSGASLEIFVTHRATRTGRFRHGAIGNYYRYDVHAGRLGARIDRCLAPGSTKPRKRCP